ncbi:MAG: gamma-glutamyl-gamma-aminobutyrate hydrolase family protein [Candidatus Berkiella sp.]
MFLKSFSRRTLFTTLVFSAFILLCLLMVNPWLQAKQESTKPLIGILLNDGGKGGYSEYPWYAMRQNYSQVIAQNGGIPVFIGFDIESLDEYINLLDGVVLTGGDFQPSQSSAINSDKSHRPKRLKRENIEYSLIKKGYDANLPMLGICAGMQQMNIALGGTNYENLKKSLGTKIQHRNETRHKTQHSISITPGTFLYKVMKVKKLEVNSNHNAGINKVANQLVVSAVAPDGVIEGFEAKNKRFFIGVMWHPEYVLSNEEKMLWTAFIEAAKTHHESK